MSAEWEAFALDSVARARSVLVLAAGGSAVQQPTTAPTVGEVPRLERRLVAPTHDGIAASLGPNGAGVNPWEAIVLGPGLLESSVGATNQLALAREALAPGGRLVVVTAGGEPALAAERSLLELGFAIRLHVPVIAAGTQPTGMEGVLHLLAAQYDGYVVRAARPGDESVVLGLFGSSFHVERSLDHWRWKYRDSPYGNGRISLAFAPTGELVGQYCAYPVHLYRTGLGTTPIHQVGDTMTARAVRGVGRGPTSIYARTARHFYAAFCAGRVAFNYGFNTGNIQQLSIRFVDAHKVAEVTYRESPLVAAPRRRWPWPAAGGYRVREIDDSDELDEASSLARALDELYCACRDRYGSLVERDSRYLRWRYLRRPDQRYRVVVVERRRRLVGWGVFTEREDTLVWGDALFLPEHSGAARRLLEAVVPRNEAARVQRVVAWFPPHPAWWDSTLRRLGFLERPEPQGLGLMVVPFVDTEAPEWIPRAHYYAYGDSDLF